MVFHELSAYVPKDDGATVGVTAQWRRRGGRPAKTPRKPEIDSDRVRLWVSSRGWRAELHTDRNECTKQNADGTNVLTDEPTGEWSEPMAETLMELAGKSRLPLADIRQVLSGDPDAMKIVPSRLTCLLGIDSPARITSQRRHDELSASCNAFGSGLTISSAAVRTAVRDDRRDARARKVGLHVWCHSLRHTSITQAAELGQKAGLGWTRCAPTADTRTSRH
jgi:hypothetical protein